MFLRNVGSHRITRHLILDDYKFNSESYSSDMFQNTVNLCLLQEEFSKFHTPQLKGSFEECCLLGCYTVWLL
jgi:hypothetical protein